MASYTFTILDDPKATSGTFAQGINDAGQVVGYYNDGTGSHGFWLDGSYSTFTSATQTQRSGLNEFIETQSVSTLEEISNSGQVVGSGFWNDVEAIGVFATGGGGTGPTPAVENLELDSANDGFIANLAGSLWTDIQAPINGTVIQGKPSSVKTYAFGINGQSDVVGYYTDLGGDHAFIATPPAYNPQLQSQPNFQELNYPGVGGATYAHGINDSGEVVGYFIGTDPNQPNVSTAHGFLYNGGAFSYFDDPNAVNGTYAEGISNTGQIVGYYVDGKGLDHGFVFDQGAGTYTTVDAPGAIKTFIYGVNDSDQLVGDYVDSAGKTHGFTATLPNPDPPAATSAVMVMAQASSGNHEIYDIGNNSVLAAYKLFQAGSPWQPVDIGHFNGSDTSDVLLHNVGTGAFELYDVVGNNGSGPVSLGATGTDWSVLGFGDFSSNPGETDMLMRQSGTFKLEVYDISNNQIVSAASMGAVGSEWQFLGVGDFSSNANETDMLMRDVNTGALEVYNVSRNSVVSATGMGAVGMEWSFVGVGNFSGNPGETDLLMRDVNNGALEVYNIHNDQVVSATSMGAVGLEWSAVGIGAFSGKPGETDMIMRDANNGAFEIYDISKDSVVSASSIGGVGTDWQTVGIASYGPSGQAASASAAAQTEFGAFGGNQAFQLTSTGASHLLNLAGDENTGSGPANAAADIAHWAGIGNQGSEGTAGVTFQDAAAWHQSAFDIL